MLMRRVIPCLDVSMGRIVKGVRFAGLRDAGDPAERAALYEAEGADEVVVLDVSATPLQQGHGHQTTRAVRNAVSIPLTVGGGVRSIADGEALLQAGADRVAVNTAAVERPDLISELASRFGNQCVVLALDAAKTPAGHQVVVRSGREQTGIDVVAWAREAAERGAGEILLTSFDADGTGAGYDLDLLRAVTAAVSIPVIASGGAAHSGHLADALRAGADAVLAATIFHDGLTTIGAIKDELAALGFTVRASGVRR